MKKRAGYVSNSSSSSFIVSYEKGAECVMRSDAGVEFSASPDDFVRLVDAVTDARRDCGDATSLNARSASGAMGVVGEWFDGDFKDGAEEFIRSHASGEVVEFDLSYYDSELRKLLVLLRRLGLVEVFTSDRDWNDADSAFPAEGEE